METPIRRSINVTMPRTECRDIQLAADLAQAARTRSGTASRRLTTGEFAARALMHARGSAHWWVYGAGFRPQTRQPGTVDTTLALNWPLSLHQVIDDDIAQLNHHSADVLDGARARRSTYLRAAIGWSAQQVRQGKPGSWVLEDFDLDDVAASAPRLDLYIAQQ